MTVGQLQDGNSPWKKQIALFLASQLVQRLQEHVLENMRGMPECQPGGPGARNKDIEETAGLGLELPYQDGWLTWSILYSLIAKGLVEAVISGHGKARRNRYRLSR